MIRCEPDLCLIRAPNPSVMTERGTNTYILGHSDLCIIDPGPDDPAHLEAICAQIGPEHSVIAILVTHAHRDHSGLAARLAGRLGAPVLGFGDATAGRSDLMRRLVHAGMSGGGEGIDQGFRPDRCLSDGETIALGADQVSALWTPGHMGNHMCFVWRDVVFTGDNVMGWASSLVSPPDGDMTAFLASLQRLQDLRARVLYPGHGDPVTDPHARIEALRSHRKLREAQILSALAHRDQTIPDLVAQIYADTPLALQPAAARNIHAHLIALWEQGQIFSDALPGPEATYRTTHTA